MAVAEEPLEPRRRPSQERSRRRFDAILLAARSSLVDTGFESFTCEEVAQRAGVPIGSLYQFFANKYALVCELDRQDLVAVQAELALFAAEIPTLDWERRLDAMCDHLAELWWTDPSRRTVWLAMQSTPATRATAAVHERALALQVSQLLAPLTPTTDRAERTIMAEVLVHVCYTMLSLSIRDGQGHQRIVEELKRLMTAYLRLSERQAPVAQR